MRIRKFRVKKSFLLFCFCILSLIKTGVAYAINLEINYPTIFGLKITSSSTLPEYTKYFFNLGIGIGSILAMSVIIFGGIHYLVSFGAGRITSSGKEWIKSGIVGLVILLCSYLIVAAINPNLTIFSLTGLVPTSLLPTPTPFVSPGPRIVNYDEIPIGTLTENVLAKAVNCYDFDGDGNPIDGDPTTPDILEPTLLNHDRIDCQLKLAEAIERKADKFKKLSDKLVELMNKCSCHWPSGTTYSPDNGELNKGLGNKDTVLASLSSPIYLAVDSFDFNISLSSSSGTVAPGQSILTTATVTLISGTAQEVTFSASGFFHQGNVYRNPEKCTPNSICTSTITLATSTDPAHPTNPETYTITIHGRSGVLDKTAVYTLTVQTGFNFSLSLSSSSGSVAPGNSISTTITATKTAGTAQSIAFSASGNPTGSTVSFNPTSCIPNCTSTMNVSTSSGTPAGTYPITITATGGGATNTTTYSLTVTGSDFSLSSLNPSEGTFLPGQTIPSASSNVKWESGGAQTVNLTVEGCPSNATCNVNPTSCNISQSTPSCSFQLNLSTTSSITSGNYTITVRGKRDTIEKTTTYILKIKAFDFDIALSPTAGTTAAGGEVIITITATKTLGTAQEVVFSASGLPPAATVSWITTDKCTPNPNCSIQIKITIDQNTPKGDYSVVIHGKWGDVDKTATYALKIKTLEPPLGFYVYPLSESEIGVSFMPADGAEKTLVVRKDGVSPSSRNDGITVYFANGGGFDDGGLGPKKVYCYRAWSYANNKYSNDSVAGCTTTLEKGDPCERNCSTCSIKPGTCPRMDSSGQCNGDCVSKPCKAKSGGEPCPAGVKKQIDEGSIIVDGLDYFGLEEFRSKYPSSTDAQLIDIVEKEVIIGGTKMKVIKKEMFFGLPGNLRARLRLIDQLRYLKAKMELFNIKNDLELLKKAEDELGKCYLIEPYVEFLNISQTADKNIEQIQVKKFVNSYDNNKNIDISKYCKGFEYSGSQCFSTCQNLCPGINQNSFSTIKTCTNDSCVKTAFYKCPSGSAYAGKNFLDCITDCRAHCKVNCNKKYPNSPDKLTACTDGCDGDSQCLIDNDTKCYVNFAGIKDCAKIYSDFNNFKDCAEKAFTCRFCTDQYSGYSDCTRYLGDEYTSSALYRELYINGNQNYLRNPFCIRSVAEQYPQTEKCPPCSSCPKCPCAKKTISGSTVYTLCSGKCAEFIYNDDPLTFYCQEKWWEGAAIEPEALGGEWYADKGREIPVGKAVDDTEKWAEGLSSLFQDFITKTKNMLDYIIDIGKETNYCQCNSICDTSGNEGCCQSGCMYNQTLIEYQDPDSGQTYSYWVCYCSKTPCSGNPCLRMINLLLGKGKDAACPKGAEYKGVGGYYDDVNESLTDLLKKVLLIDEQRSEALKKLTYSRKMMNGCSQLLTSLGETDVNLLNCERVMDEKIPPFVWKFWGIALKSRYCYGKNLAKDLDGSPPFTDNWFCIERVIK